MKKRTVIRATMFYPEDGSAPIILPVGVVGDEYENVCSYRFIGIDYPGRSPERSYCIGFVNEEDLNERTE